MPEEKTGKKEDEARAPSSLEASSGPQEKGASDDLRILLAQLEQRAQGLPPSEVEEEIARFVDKLIDRHAKVVPENLRAQHRALLRDMVEQDPTLVAMLGDLRRGITKR